MQLLKRLPWLGGILTAVLLAAAFPPLEWSGLAWVALAPLLVSFRFLSRRDALCAAYGSGALFWTINLAWLRQVTWAGWILLALYCALYFLPWAWFAQRMIQPAPPRKKAGLAVFAPAFGFARLMALLGGSLMFWCAGEWARSVFFTGFPWNSMGVSQFMQIPLIQVAEFGGIYLVSALLVLANTLLAVVVLHAVNRLPVERSVVYFGLLLAGLPILAAQSYGRQALRAPVPTGDTLRIALVQINIPQNLKWDAVLMDEIQGRLETWTDVALKTKGLDLIVWPETALPDELRYSDKSFALVRRLSQRGTPLLVGAMDFDWQGDRRRYHNSSFLLNGEGDIVTHYDKQHLVILGEYMPFHQQIPALNKIMAWCTGTEDSYYPGREATVMSLPYRGTLFSVLICFEDIFAGLAREFVRAGARLLVNQTNDAWFDPSCGSRQHLANAVFRCVENRVPAVRATNTGMTCFVDRFGRVVNVLLSPSGDPRVAGILSGECDVPAAGRPLTVYTRHGDVFAGLCLAGSLLLALAARRRCTN